MKPNAQTVLIAAVVFAIAMGALQDGGWWLWFGVAWLVVIGPRLPLFGRVKISAANRYIMRENRKVRRDTRKLLAVCGASIAKIEE